MMKSIFSMLQYPAVFEHFQAISEIPRGSGYEKQISDYVLAFARGLNLEAWQDEAHNVVVRKPASKGRETDPVVMIQGHLDMVWDKAEDSPHCFETDPIRLIVDGDWIHADGTTLGGDDGVAVAYALALMEDQEHSLPPLEFVLTSGEETGLIGARVLDKSKLKARYMINLDSEREDEVLTSCAGGLRLHFETKVQRRDPPSGYIPAIVRVYGLRGGHSGDDINKNRGNAIKLMSDFLFKWYNYAFDSRMVSIRGGSKENAIPRECEAKLWIPLDKRENMDRGCWWFGEDLAKHFGASDPDAKIAVSYPDIHSIDPAAWRPVMDEDSGRFLSFMNLSPNGVINMSKQIDGLVETSCNMGIIDMTEDTWKLVISLRSSEEDKKEILRERFEMMAEMNRITFSPSGNYPGWAYQENSVLRDLYIRAYGNLFQREVRPSAIHAGVECGLFVSAMHGLDAISIGPNMENIHSPKERLSISSTERVWQTVLEVLEKLH